MVLTVGLFDAALRQAAVVTLAAPSTVAALLKSRVPTAAQAVGKTCAAAVRRLSATVDEPPCPRPADSVPTVRSGFGRADTDRPAIYLPALRWVLYHLTFSGAFGLAPIDVHASITEWLVGTAIIGETVYLTISRLRLASKRRRGAAGGPAEAPRERPVFLILVVTYEERDAVFSAVRRYAGPPKGEVVIGQFTVYRLGVVGGADILLAKASEQGTASAAAMLFCAREVVPRLRPDYVILTGICFGLREFEGQVVGDVIVARRIHTVDPVRIGDPDVVFRGTSVGSSPRLLDRCIAAQAAWPGPAAVHTGTVITSNALVDSMETVNRLRNQVPDAIAGEMEAAGVYEVATRDPKPDWIMVKAISDFGHDRAAGVYPATAAQNAAEFIVFMISRGGLPIRS